MSVASVIVAMAIGQARAADYPETVVVGDIKNIPDRTGFGSVDYAYRIGKYEVTNEEYAEFLNAVEKSGKYGLYRWQMGAKQYSGIRRSGSPGNYTYTVKEGMARKPAVLMNWTETLYFCNWLSNGKGEGSVETGPYTFENEWGTVSVKTPDHAKLAAGEKVQWVLPTENEWYKAAYYDPEKTPYADYWIYPARGNRVPAANLNSNHPTDVGSFTDSPSAYGTFDQGGNAWEWNETAQGGNRGVRGGSYWINDHSGYMQSSARYNNTPDFVFDNYGFRVVALGGTPVTPGE